LHIKQCPSIVIILLLSFFCMTSVWSQDERSSANDPILKEYLKKYPKADTDMDGTLGLWEFEAHLPQDYFKDIKGKHEHLMMPLRDGVKLATEIFIPEGEGKRPTVLIRTGYGRLGVGRYAQRWIERGFVVVAQDPRGNGASEGREDVRDSNSFANEIPDTYDTIDWITKQPWSNGRVGTVGGSGHGMPATIGKWNGHPGFVYSNTGNTVGHWMHWLFHNGVRRQTYNWLNSYKRIVDRKTPTTMSWDWAPWRAQIKEWAAQQEFVYVMSGGWYDPFLESDLKSYTALQDSGRAFVTIEPRGHGGINGLKPVPKETIHPEHAAIPEKPDMTKVLQDGLPEPTQSKLRYYLMGDVKNPEAPGNVWRNTDRWPIEYEKTTWFLTGENGLTTNTTPSGGEFSFRYDPNNPAPSVGGHYAWDWKVSGALDQRPLLEREDTVLFQSEPLKQPFIITGPMQAHVVFSTDVEDTTIILKLIDIYPDGYHALIKETAGMARYSDGWDKPGKPVEAGKKYTLDLDWGATAYAFDEGHRIAVLITGSSTPAYQIHPNRFEPVGSLEGAPVATTQIITGPDATRIVLPKVEDDGR
jgi:uncharacterized protein